MASFWEAGSIEVKAGSRSASKWKGGSLKGSFWSIERSKSGKKWVVGSGSASVSNWKVGSGSASEWKVGSGSASEWKAGPRNRKGSRDWTKFWMNLAENYFLGPGETYWKIFDLKNTIGSAKLFLIFLFMCHVCTIHPSVHNGRVITVVNPLAPRNIRVL